MDISKIDDNYDYNTDIYKYIIAGIFTDFTNIVKEIKDEFSKNIY